MKKKTILGIIAAIVIAVCIITVLIMNISYMVTTFAIIEDNYSAEVTDDGTMIFTVNSGGRQGEWTIDLVPEMFKPDFFNNLEDGCAEFHIIPIREGKGDMAIRFTSDDGGVEQYTLTLSISRHKRRYLQIDTLSFENVSSKV